MIMPKGGRGHKVPYETCTVRIPADIRDRVDSLAEQYRLSVFEGREFRGEDLPALDDVIVEAKKLLAQKRSGKQLIIKLLQVIYKIEISEKDLG